MKNRLRHIVLSYALLFFFSAGQIIAYAHQHPVNCSATTAADQHKQNPQHTFDYKCSICQLMDHSHMILFQMDVSYTNVVIRDTPYILQCHYYSNQLIPSSGRGPPQV